MTDGGTIWMEVPPDCCAEDLQGPAGAGLSHLLPVLREYGRFAYLEGNSRGYEGFSQLNPCHYCSHGSLTCPGDVFHTPVCREQCCSQENPLQP